MMVYQTRRCAKWLIPVRAGDQLDLPNVILHHPSLTAKPLFDIFRAIIGEILKSETERERRGISIKDRDSINGVLASISREITDLTRMRNSLLHGTWFVGITDIDAETFIVEKFDLAKEGLSPTALPQKAEDLQKYTDSCDEMFCWIGAVFVSVAHANKIGDHFRHDGKEWTKFSDFAGPPWP